MDNNLPDSLGDQYVPIDLSNNPLAQAAQNPEFLESIKQNSTIMVQQHFEELLKTTTPNIPNRTELFARELKSQTQELQRLNDENAKISQQLETANDTMKQQLDEIDKHKMEILELKKQTRYLKQSVDAAKHPILIAIVSGVLSMLIFEFIMRVIIPLFIHP